MFFETEAGVVCQQGQAAKVRVSHRFTVAQSRYPGRTQGDEWVWEFREDFPSGTGPVLATNHASTKTGRHLRVEQWLFLSREIGGGILHLHLGATHKTVPQSSGSENSFRSLWRKPGATTKQEPVLLLRMAYTIRRWT